MNAFVTDVLRGATQIVAAQPQLLELALRSGQHEALADIHYYLDKPGLLHRTPVLLIVRRRESLADTAESNGELAGAVLLFQYKIAGIPLGMYTSNDRSGRRNVIAPPEERLAVAICGAEHLLAGGANLIMLSMRPANLSDPLPEDARRGLPKHVSSVTWTVRERDVPDFLPLKANFDETLAQVGKRTRTHMRYYRRRAEEKLGCTFHPDLDLTQAELLAFNRECMYPVPDQVATWRLRALRQFEHPLLMGLKNSQGRILSLVAGRRFDADCDVLWQMNRGDLPGHSLSLAMRTFLIEHESVRGMRRLYLDGGTAHSLSHAFIRARVTDIAVVRRTLVSFLVRKLARILIPPDNELAHLLRGDTEHASAPRVLRPE